ncbi:MAG: dual specificity protein phosphatase family protein [Planctomycetota bacterium]
MPANFSWLVPDRVAGMACPMPDDWERLRRAGVTALVSLTLSAPRNLDGFRLLHLPVPDMGTPTVRQIRFAAEFIREVVAGGGCVAVHCGAGMGRTGTILAGVLVADGVEPGEAIRRVRDLRPGSLETGEQEQAVHDYAAFLESDSP